MLKTIRKHGITLAIFAAGSTGLTAAINQLTKTTIAEQASLQQKALFDQVIPSERYNNALAKSCFVVQAPEFVKVSIAFISPNRAINRWAPSWKQPRQMAIPVRFSCWWEPI